MGSVTTLHQDCIKILLCAAQLYGDEACITSSIIIIYQKVLYHLALNPPQIRYLLIWCGDLLHPRRAPCIKDKSSKNGMWQPKQLGNKIQKQQPKNGDTRHYIALWNALVNVQLHIPGDPENVRLGHHHHHYHHHNHNNNNNLSRLGKTVLMW